MSAFEVRRAAAGDARGIAEVQTRSSQAAYRGIAAQGYLDGLRPELRVPVWDNILSTGEWPERGTLVAGNGDGTGVVGFLSFYPPGDNDVDPATVGEVAAIYVLPAYWGRGVGGSLMAQGLRAIAESGRTEAVLWVLEANDSARGFYAANGWSPDGATKPHRMGAETHLAVRYRRPVR
jgi:GNAT superfamily N-acetyltransferase